MLPSLDGILNLKSTFDIPLSLETRFGIGGPARVLADAGDEPALAEVYRRICASGTAHSVIGGGTNLIVADEGFPGIVLRYTAPRIEIEGQVVRVEAGAMLQHLVDRTIRAGLRGLETMTGIPGWVGGAIYGNAGAYGHSIQERIRTVRFFDGKTVREIGNAECEFAYRESVFKRHKDWIILSADLVLDEADSGELGRTAAGILEIRNAKYPPTMRCAGSIFKNLMLRDLPESARREVPASVIREGKVPSAWFLEQVGAKGMIEGGVRVADYHANLIYNAGGGTAREVCSIIEELKRRVTRRFGLGLEEEVQYVGFAR